MTYRLTSAQRCVLADCTRSSIVGWLLTDPHCDQLARRWEHKATTILGFSFSRFIAQAMTHLGNDYRPGSITHGVVFPLSIAEVSALANDVELEMATDVELLAAGIISAHSPYGQPQVGSRDWYTYTAMLTALGLSIDDDCPHWRQDVRSILRPFRRAVASAHVTAAAE